MGVAAILTWNKVGANFPHHIFYGQLVPSGALWSFGHFWPQSSSYGLRPYPAIIGLLGQFPPHQLPGLHLGFWAWGGSFCPLGASRPPTASTACGP
ncbi:hypothetical protein O181_060362 [Austropuccinia psidii MF-1]|uniref:Uncharacterized protein n=1 Tax=Austropuccinia psidii MF-1 TaxID=1389203 RepID=A0A9Q3HYC8_9BASI|nr:hypothetical protein [Austropuccinia psidii MF-1]